jgi:hypothetical protein
MKVEIVGTIRKRQITKRFDLPDNWGQVSPEKIVKMSQFLLLDNPHNRIEAIKILMPADGLALFLSLYPIQVYEIAARFDWLYSTPIPDKPAIESVQLGREKYYLPAEWMKNSVLIEFVYADTYLEKVIAGDSSSIDSLILCLCRPKRTDKYKKADWNGDVREKFNPELIEERLSLVKNMKVEEKIYILLWFISCKRTFAKRYPVLFTERKMETKPKQPNFGWLGIIYDLAGDLSNEETIQYKNLHNVFFFMVKKYYDHKAQEEAMNKKNDYI